MPEAKGPVRKVFTGVLSLIREGACSTDDQSRATKQEQANLCAVTVLCAST